MKKNDLKLISSFIGTKDIKQEMNFALVARGAVYATDTRKAIKLNYSEIGGGNALVHKKLLDGLCNALRKDEKLFYDNNCLHTDNIKLNIDTAYYLEDENGKNKIGAKAENYPDLEKVINIKLPFHFTLDNINNLQWELTQKNCFIADVHLNPVIAYNDCSFFDVYYKPQTKNEKEEIETATVKIVASKTDENGVIYNKFTAVFMGVVFESKAKGEL